MEDDRWLMPTIRTNIDDNSNKMTKISNITDIALSLHCSPLCILKYFEIDLNKNTKYDNQKHIGIINGSHQINILKDILKAFIKDFILCPKCKLPQISKCKIIETQSMLLQGCGGCGWQGRNSSKHQLKQFIINHKWIPLLPLYLFEEKKKEYFQDYRRVEFLRGCINFKTVQQNFVLLLNGDIRRNKSNMNIPLDIILFIFKMSYDEKHFKKENKWKVDNTVYKEQLITFIAPQICHKLLRKVWKIYINSTTKVNRIKVAIVLVQRTFSTFVKQQKYPLILNNNTWIKSGDIISILFIRYSYNTSNLLIHCEINNVISKQNINIKNLKKGTRYRLGIISSNSIELQILQ